MNQPYDYDDCGLSSHGGRMVSGLSEILSGNVCDGTVARPTTGSSPHFLDAATACQHGYDGSGFVPY